MSSHIDISQYYLENINVDKRKRVVLLQIKPYRTDFFVNNQGQYKFVTIRRNDVKYIGELNLYQIDQGHYENEKNRKGIDNSYQFAFSMHRDEVIYIEREVKNKDKSSYISRDVWKFTATNNDKTNKIEVKPMHYYEDKRLMITIGKNIIKLRKMHTDQLGKMYESKNNELKLEFAIDKI